MAVPAQGEERLTSEEGGLAENGDPCRGLHSFLRWQQATNGHFPSCHTLSIYHLIPHRPEESLLSYPHFRDEETRLRGVNHHGWWSWDPDQLVLKFMVFCLLQNPLLCPLCLPGPSSLNALPDSGASPAGPISVSRSLLALQEGEIKENSDLAQTAHSSLGFSRVQRGLGTCIWPCLDVLCPLSEQSGLQPHRPLGASISRSSKVTLLVTLRGGAEIIEAGR